MANQNSIISYVPQPFFIAGTAATIAADTNIDSIENTPGIFDPDLSNFTTVVPTASASSFTVKIDFPKSSAHLASLDVSIGLIGCALLTYEDDGFGGPDLTTKFSENIVCKMQANVGTVVTDQAAVAHNSQDTINTFNGVARPSVISGGRANVVFTGLGAFASGATGTIYVTLYRAAGNVSARPHVRLIIGHLFIGADFPVTIDPKTFSWTLEVDNERFHARDFGAINSDGTLVKRSSGEILRIPHSGLVGTEVTGVAPIVETVSANVFDLIKANTSYPILFNPYPVGPVAYSTLTTAEANLTARQNFFSLYGFLSDPMELLADDFRDGLNSQYRARYRIIETR
jgi:hypothetical protein